MALITGLGKPAAFGLGGGRGGNAGRGWSGGGRELGAPLYGIRAMADQRPGTAAAWHEQIPSRAGEISSTNSHLWPGNPALTVAGQGLPQNVETEHKSVNRSPLPLLPSPFAAYRARSSDLARAIAQTSAAVKASPLGKAKPDANSPARPRKTLPEPAFGMMRDDVLTAEAASLSLPGTGPDVARLAAAESPNDSAALSNLPGAGASAPFSVDDELIIEFRTAQGEISETITAYGNRAETYLPLGEIARLLDVAIIISDEGRYASGWVLDDKQIITLNLRAGMMTVGGIETPLKRGDAHAMDGEMFVRSGLFSGLMPLELKIDLRAQTVTAQTKRPFPFEERAAREAAREGLAARGVRQGPTPYPPEATPYRVLDVPMGELEVRGVSDVARGTRTEADLRLAGDFAWMTGQLYVSASSRDGATAARATLGRRDPDGGLLGPLKASVFEVGDVTTDALAIGLRGIAGRGLTVSNLPIERASVFDRIDLRGELLAGWEAELYRNNTLIGSTSVAINGRYEFLQIPVEFGLNVFRIALYGPQGQRREVVQHFSVGDGRLSAGELRYSVSLAQRDVNLFGLTGPDFIPSLDFGRWRSTGQVSYGVNSAVTANFGAGWQQGDDGTRWLATAGLRAGLGRLAGQINIATNDVKGMAFDARLAAKTFGVSWTALHAEYKGRFADELRTFSVEPVRRASEADLTANLRLGSGDKALSVPLAARFRRIEFADRRIQTDASLRASTVYKQMLFSNTLTLFRTDTPGFGKDSQVTGSFDLSTLSSGRTRYRAAIDYRLTPGRKVTRAAAEIDRTFGPDTLFKASVGRLFETGETALGASAVHRLGPLALALDANMILPRKEHSVVLRVGFSFGRNPVSRGFFLAQPGLTAGGAVAVKAFADGNGNRVHDPDEALIEGVEIDTGAQVARTGPGGVALLGQLGNATRSFVRMNAETLPDIAMAPDRAGFAIKPRPGRIHVSQFAVDMLGEIEGTAAFGQDRRGVSGLALVLLNAEGAQVARARTGAGGTFLFEQVRPGRYRLEIEANQAKRLGLAAGKIEPIVIDAAHPIVRVTLPVSKLQNP
ncbi:carboxypeptidase-like regulatory domain-containing protein [Novosphingobium sp.]|uniref:carboxypeptidase-like regulatory domain-containing protein n=1 Tax=Novosphingobium sp. TaxID=1874826 RepID=UPI0026307367|nr:carboxypeptidase-like regulatory domain-containing protein [Novosphingobium sp.]